MCERDSLCVKECECVCVKETECVCVCVMAKGGAMHACEM